MIRRLCFLTLLLTFFIGTAPSSHAATLACTGTETISDDSYVFYDHSAGTCIVTDSNPFRSFETGDIRVALSPTGANSAIFFYADNALAGSEDNYNFISCSAGDDGVKTFGVSGCQDASIATGSYTSTMTVNVASGVQATISIATTVVATTSMDITSASVTLPDSNSGANDNEEARKNLQTDVSKSQSVVVSTNIGSRINTIGSPAGIGRTTPSGVGRETPGGVGRDTPGGVGRSIPQDQSTNFQNDIFDPDLAREGNQTLAMNSIRQLAMLASFDTSNLILAATDTDQATGSVQGSVQDRQNLLVDRPFTAWGHGSYTNVENERNRIGDDSRYDGDVWGYNMGGDYRFRDDLYAGISVGYSETDLVTLFNSGTYKEENWSITPYAVYNLNQNVKLSALGGYSFGDLSQTRDSGTVSSNTDTSMWFMGLNASYKFKPNTELPLDLTTRVSFLASRKTVDAYVESDQTAIDESISRTQQLKPGLEAAYTFDSNGTIIQPFAKLDFVYDLKDAVNSDDTAYDIGGGLRVGNSKEGISGTIEGQTQLGRSDYKEYSISGMLAYGFYLGGSSEETASLVTPYIQSNYTDETQIYETGVEYEYSLGIVKFGFDASHEMINQNKNQATSAMATIKMNF